MRRPSLSQRRAKEIVERSGGDRFRRGATDRVEVGSGGLIERTEGARVLRVGGNLTESTGGDHTTRARRVERTIRGLTHIDGVADTILLGGAMTEVHAGAELVLAGMSDDLVLGAGSRVTAVLDLWVTGLLGIEEKLATSAFDGVFVDTSRTLFEREYGTGVHRAGSAMFSGAIYATQATGFRRLMRVSSGVRNLSSGGGGGAGTSTSASGSTSTTPSPGSTSGPGLLGSAAAPSGHVAGWDSTDLARLADNAQSSEDAARYRRTESVSETVTELQTAARNQVAGERPETAARAPSRMESASGPSVDATRATVDDASPSEVQPVHSGPDRRDAPRSEPVWSPSSRRKRAYTMRQVRVGETFEEFRFEAVVRERPDKLLSDDAQANWDGAAFGILYDVRDEVTDMSHQALLQADPKIDPGDVSDMSAIDARRHLLALRNGAANVGDTEEARRLQDLLHDLDRYAFERYSTGLAEAEAAHELTPLKLPSHVDGTALEQQLRALAQEQFAQIDDPTISNAKRHEASKLGTAYSMAAQDANRGLHPLASLQPILDSGLGEADAYIYSHAATRISAIIAPIAPFNARLPAARSLWSRAGDIAGSLLARVKFHSRPSGGLSRADDLSSAHAPIRFLDEPQTVRLPDSIPFSEPPVHAVDVPPGGSDSGRPIAPSATPDPPNEAASRLRPTQDGNGAHWSSPDASNESSGTPPWSDP